MGIDTLKKVAINAHKKTIKALDPLKINNLSAKALTNV